MGLYQNLKAQGIEEEAKIIKLEFDTAWKDADILIDNPYFNYLNILNFT